MSSFFNSQLRLLGSSICRLHLQPVHEDCCIAVLHSTMWIYHILFVKSIVDNTEIGVYLGPTKNIVMNTVIEIFQWTWWIMNVFLLDIYLEMELLGRRLCQVQIWIF